MSFSILSSNVAVGNANTVSHILAVSNANLTVRRADTAAANLCTNTFIGGDGTIPSFSANTCSSNSYNLVLSAGNDTGAKLSMFVNGSARGSANSANNAVVIRNDGGQLQLGSAGNTTLIAGNANVVGNLSVATTNVGNLSAVIANIDSSLRLGTSTTLSENAGLLVRTNGYDRFRVMGDVDGTKGNCVVRFGTTEATLQSSVGTSFAYMKDVSGTPYFGLNTYSPTAQLHVAGNAKITGSLNFGNKIGNCFLTLWGDSYDSNTTITNDSGVYGFGINDSTLRYQASYLASHKFYGGATLFAQINSSGVTAPTFVNANDSGSFFNQTQLALYTGTNCGVTFRHLTGNSAFFFNNGTTFFLLRGAANTAWNEWSVAPNGYWPIQVTLANNDIQLGGNVYIPGGRLGVGTTGPSYPAHIIGTCYVQGALVMNELRPICNAWHRSWEDDKSRLFFATNGRTYYGAADGHEWRNSGNGGIMTLTDGGALSVYADFACNNGLFHLSGTGVVNAQGWWIQWNRDGGGGGTWYMNQVGLGSGGGHMFGEATTNNVFTEYMRLTGSGYLGLGTASPSWRCHIEGDLYANGWLRSGGNTGWYNQTYGGGWWMLDSTYVRVYGNKCVYGADSSTTSFYSVGSAGTYNMFGIAANDTGDKLVMFCNGSARSADGGVNTATVRNDGGTFRLGHPSYNTWIDCASFGVGTGSPSASYKMHVYGNSVVEGYHDVTGTMNIGGKSLALGYNVATSGWQNSRLALIGYTSYGYLFGAYALVDGINLAYNYYHDGATETVPNYYQGTSRITLGFGYVNLYAGTTNTAPTTLALQAGGNASTGGLIGINTTVDSNYALRVQGNAYVTGNFRTITYYNANDTAVYWNQNELALRGASSTITLRNTGSCSAFLYNNSNTLSILRGSTDTASGGWSTVNGYWPLECNLTNNAIQLGGNVYIPGGRLGVGTTGPSYPAHIVGTCYIQGDLVMDNLRPECNRWHTSWEDSVARLYFATNGRTYYRGADGHEWRSNANGFLMDLSNTGYLAVANDITAFASDERLKTNIRPIENALEKVRALRGVHFDWREETHQPMKGSDVGLIAQDVLQVMPESIRPAPFDSEYLTICMGHRLTALLVEAVKQLSTEVSTLNMEIETLKQAQVPQTG